MPKTTILSQNLKRIRQERKATYEEFAEELGIGKSTLFEICKGKTVPNFATVVQIANRLEMPLSELLASPEELLQFATVKGDKKIHPLLLPLLENFLRELIKLSDELFEQQGAGKDEE